MSSHTGGFHNLPSKKRWEVGSEPDRVSKTFSSDEVLLFSTLSWDDAVEEAGKMIGSLRLGRDLTGQTIDLTEALRTLPFEGVFRDMVIDAAKRKLKKRGAKEIILGPRM